MDTPSPRYIITRALFLVAALVAILYGVSFIKKYQRRSAIVAELKLITADSSFFQQFYAEDAQKTLVKAIALIAEAKDLGLSPESTIDQVLNVNHKLFDSDDEKDEPAPRVKIIGASLRANFQNFLKLGYQSDYQTLSTMKSGELPSIPGGPESGKRPVIGTLINPSLSPGIERVIANLEIRPPQSEGRPATDIEIAAAKQLARDLYAAKLIEEAARDRILEKLTPVKNP